MKPAIVKKFVKKVFRETVDRVVGKCRDDLADIISEKLNSIIEGTKEEIEQEIDSWQQNFLQSGINGNGLLLPTGTRFVVQRPGCVYFVIEQKPQVRTVLFSKKFAGSQYYNLGYNERKYLGKDAQIKKNFRLAFPYVVFIICFNDDLAGCIYDMYVFFTRKPLKSLKDPLFMAALPDVDDCGVVCLSDVISGINKVNTYAQRVECLVASFWQSSFDDDIHRRFEEQAAKTRALKSIWHWEKESKKDPNFGLRVRWVEAKGKIERLRQSGKDETLTPLKIIENDANGVIGNDQNTSIYSLRDKVHHELNRAMRSIQNFIYEIPRGDNPWKGIGALGTQSAEQDILAFLKKHLTKKKKHDKKKAMI